MRPTSYLHPLFTYIFIDKIHIITYIKAMKNIIEWTKKALKQVAALPDQAVQQIYSSVQNLEQWPETPNVKTLRNRSDYRLRVGRYRVFFTVRPDGGFTIIRIEEVKKRDEHTY